MKSLRRPAVYQGVTFSDYEVDFYTSDVYRVGLGKGARLGRVLKSRINPNGYPCFNLRHMGETITIRQHQLLAETFPDLLPKSPIVSHDGLQIGNDRNELKNPTGFNFICNLVCPDHIDGNKANNHHTNLMIATQFENILKCAPRKGRKHKGITKIGNSYRVQIQFGTILDEDGRYFRKSKYVATEEEAALVYNTMLEEALLTIFGLDLGPKMYDLAYKNVIETPVQEQLILG